MKMRGFAYAKKASENSDFGLHQLGAVLMYGGKVIAVGWNSDKTHSIQNQYNHYRDFEPDLFPAKLHAEMMVLNKVKFLDIDFSKAEIYVWRGKNGQPQMSKPCKACEARIRDMGIKKVHYTTNGGYCTKRYD